MVMAFPSIKEILQMQFAFDTVGICYTPLPNANVAALSQPTMP